jgi:hypothetical protein
VYARTLRDVEGCRELQGGPPGHAAGGGDGIVQRRKLKRLIEIHQEQATHPALRANSRHRPKHECTGRLRGDFGRTGRHAGASRSLVTQPAPYWRECLTCDTFFVDRRVFSGCRIIISNDAALSVEIVGRFRRKSNRSVTRLTRASGKGRSSLLPGR